MLDIKPITLLWTSIVLMFIYYAAYRIIEVGKDITEEDEHQKWREKHGLDKEES